MYRVELVRSKSQWADFLNLPWEIYKDDPYWVPPLKIAVRDQLDVNKNPFFKHAFMYPLIAYEGDVPVGRVVGVIDEDHNRFHQERTVLFGFYESINNLEVCKQLLDQVVEWGANKGMTNLRGPINLSTNYECGLLIEGFDSEPAVMMNHNPPYYADLLESYGLEKAKDLLAYEVHEDRQFNERLIAHAERLKEKGQVSFRPVNMKNFKKEVDLILDIYNDAWEKNWGFVPMGPEEFHHMAKDMKLLVDPELLLLAEVRGYPVGFSLCLPDVNQVFKKVKDGRLFPTGLFKLLWNLKGPGRKKTLDRVRILTLGIRKQYAQMGIGPLLYMEYVKRCPPAGYPRAEASWILEDNVQMNKALRRMKAEKTKTYRVYDRPIESAI